MLKLTLRELLMPMAVVGLILGWQLDHRRQMEVEKSHLQRVRIAEQQYANLVIMLGRSCRQELYFDRESADMSNDISVGDASAVPFLDRLASRITPQSPKR